jgi:hypothetical protein
MQSKLFVLAIVGPTILTFASQSSANILISYGYNGSNYTTNLDPQNLGFHMGGSVSLSFDSSVLTANDVTGTYTLSGGPNGIATFINVTSGGYIVASSQGPDAIDPLSFITFDHGLVTSWAIRGTYPYDTVLVLTSPLHLCRASRTRRTSSVNPCRITSPSYVAPETAFRMRPTCPVIVP